MKTFLPKFALKKYSTYVVMFVIFVHNYVLDKDMNCTCDKEDELTCHLYMALPFFILFALQLWTDETFKRIWKYTCPVCDGCRFKFFLVLFFKIMKAVCVGMLWVVFLLIEGDWAVCCYNTFKEHPQLGCKEQKQNLTAEEQDLVGKLKNTSMLIGLGILLTGFFMVTCVLPLGWNECCGRNCQSCCDKKLLYDQMLLEEEGPVLTEMIREAAKEKLTKKMKEKLGSETWGECFNAAEELIENETPPGKKDDILLEDFPERKNLL